MTKWYFHYTDTMTDTILENNPFAVHEKRLLEQIPSPLRKELDIIARQLSVTPQQLENLASRQGISFIFKEGAPDVAGGIGGIEISEKRNGVLLTLSLADFEDPAYGTEEILHLVHFILNPGLVKTSMELSKLQDLITASKAKGVNTALACLYLGRMSSREETELRSLIDTVGQVVDSDEIHTFEDLKQKISLLDQKSLVEVVRNVIRLYDQVSIPGNSRYLLHLFPGHEVREIESLYDHASDESERDPKRTDFTKAYDAFESYLDERLRIANFEGIDFDLLRSTLRRIFRASQQSASSKAIVETVILSFFDDLPVEPEARSKLLANPLYMKEMRRLLLESPHSPVAKTAKDYGTDVGSFVHNPAMVVQSPGLEVTTTDEEHALMQILRDGISIQMHSEVTGTSVYEAVAKEHIQKVTQRHRELGQPISLSEVEEMAVQESIELSQLEVRAQLLNHSREVVMEPVAKVLATHRYREVSGWTDYVHPMLIGIYSGLLTDIEDWMESVRNLATSKSGFLLQFLQARDFNQQQQVVRQYKSSEKKKRE